MMVMGKLIWRNVFFIQLKSSSFEIEVKLSEVVDFKIKNLKNVSIHLIYLPMEIMEVT